MTDTQSPIDLDAVDRDIAQLVGQSRGAVDYAPPAQRREDVDRIGRLTSEAVAAQYGEAVKALEAMGEELLLCVRDTETMAAACNEAIAYVKETCEMYRAESKKISDRIAHAAMLTSEVRSVCDDLRARIQTPPETTATDKVDAAAARQ